MEQVYNLLGKKQALDIKAITLPFTTAALSILANDAMIPGATPSGAYSFCPDWSTLRAGPIDGHVSCYGEFQELDGSPSSLCPRTLLRKVLEKAATQGTEFLIGFEIEFIAMDRSPDDQDSKYQTIRNDGHSWSASRVLADWGREGSFSTALDEIFDHLKAAGIIIEQLHAEAAPGQLSNRWLHVMDIGPQSTRSRGLTLAAQHRMLISRYPPRVAISRKSTNPSMQVLRNIPFYSDDSISRAILAAGTDGILNHIELSWGDLQGDPASLTETERKDLGVTEMLPSNLEEALGALGADERLVHLLNPVLAQRYIDVKNAEIALLTPMTAESRRQWILERY
ncbi:hypothetical protein SLS62_007000 [Diatrype stigma]|uniref:GS catalytic domain-containing protein n=1 Tax=Diatrype stigma TaxID=117547 RepID=A0AAN9URL2_9PEZI